MLREIIVRRVNKALFNGIQLILQSIYRHDSIIELRDLVIRDCTLITASCNVYRTESTSREGQCEQYRASIREMLMYFDVY
jgi:hypothetical protein